MNINITVHEYKKENISCNVGGIVVCKKSLYAFLTTIQA